MSLTVITGGGRGIGAATAVRLASDGHDLVLSYARDQDAADATARRVRDLGVTCRVVRADVSDADDVDALFDAAAEQGQLTGLVNNAGSTLHLGDLADTPVDVVRRGGRRQPHRRDPGRPARRCVTSSRAARSSTSPRPPRRSAARTSTSTTPRPRPASTRSRWASPRRSRPRGIRVNGVAPGIVRTDIHAAAGDPDRLERVAPAVPMGRVGEPAEIAEAIAWLLGDGCPYATGATLRVAGGR